MATTEQAPGAILRKTLSVVGMDDTSLQGTNGGSKRSRRARLRPTPHLTPDQFIRLLAFIEDEGGITTLDEISRALPRVLQPISAVFDLCDADILCADWESAFDGDMRVWRVDR